MLPASRDPLSSGMTTKQLDCANAVKSPDPCHGTRATFGSSFTDELNSQRAGRKRVSPGFPLRSVARESSASTKRG